MTTRVFFHLPFGFKSGSWLHQII